MDKLSVSVVIISLLTKLIASNPAEWHKYVDKTQQCINVPTRSTSVSLFNLLCDIRIRVKENLKINELLEEGSKY